MLETFNHTNWNETYDQETRQRAVEQLESGHILYFPQMPFVLSDQEQKFLTPEYADPDSKNIGYLSGQNKIWGVRNLSDQERNKLKNMLRRYAQQASALIQNLLPGYQSEITIGRTSFRPVQVSNRKTSYRKDDKRLHVDAFPSAPIQGKRILRVFCNINPTEDRVWRIGEPFEAVAKRFLPRIGKPLPFSAALLRLLKITKSMRTPYDHYMLHLHDNMKRDDKYQQTADQQEVRFPPGATWIVQTDHVSHAAMQGQHMLEQTFYLPVSAMQNESLAPIRVLENMLKQKLA